MPYRKAKSWGRTKPPCGTPINMGDPLALGLVAAYLFAEGAGSTVINSVANDASTGLLNKPTTGWGNGDRGSAYNGAASTWVDIGMTSKPARLNLPGAMTALARIKPTTVPTTTIVSDSNAAESLGQFSMFIRITNKLANFWGNGAAQVSGNTSIVANVWTSVGTTRSGSSGSWSGGIWLNGLLDASASGIATNPGAQQGAAIGRNGNGSGQESFVGLIDYVYIWARSLSATEILWVHADPYSMFATPRRRIISGSAAAATLPPVNNFRGGFARDMVGGFCNA